MSKLNIQSVATPITTVECSFSVEHDRTAGRADFMPLIYTVQRGGIKIAKKWRMKLFSANFFVGG